MARTNPPVEVRDFLEQHRSCLFANLIALVHGFVVAHELSSLVSAIVTIVARAIDNKRSWPYGDDDVDR